MVFATTSLSMSQAADLKPYMLFQEEEGHGKVSEMLNFGEFW